LQKFGLLHQTGNFDLIPYYKRSYDEKFLAKKDFKNLTFSSKIAPSLIWSGRQDLSRLNH